MMFETYRLTLTHYIAVPESGEKIILDDPVVIEQSFERNFSSGSPIVLNRMLDEMKSFVLARKDEVTA